MGQKFALVLRHAAQIVAHAKFGGNGRQYSRRQGDSYFITHLCIILNLAIDHYHPFAIFPPDEGKSHLFGDRRDRGQRNEAAVR